MKVGLFVPCYVDQFYPQVAIASLKLLEKLGCTVDVPLSQTCCGQPLANSGMEKEAASISRHFVDTFSEYEWIVSPSASCTYHVQHHFDNIPQNEMVIQIRERTKDLTEFLVDILAIEKLSAHFPFKVSLHQSCHGLRGSRMAKSSELMEPQFSKWRYLLDQVSGITLVTPPRSDECCGFGGTFAIKEAAVSVKMGQDRIKDHMVNKVEYITSGDMSCLMHMEGIIKREKWPVKVIHLAEILNAS